MFKTLFLCFLLLNSFKPGGKFQPASDRFGKIDSLPRDLEMQLALSALPPHLRDSASVYILNLKKGFELARKGSNGFSCFVARTGDDAKKAGVSYMLSPILCTYIDPDENDSVMAANNPHIMYYAPDVTNRDLGGTNPSFRSAYPFIILAGPYGYSIQAIGAAERTVINQEYQGMLDRLCQINPKWCMSKSQLDGPAPMHHHY